MPSLHSALGGFRGVLLLFAVLVLWHGQMTGAHVGVHSSTPMDDTTSAVCLVVPLLASVFLPSLYRHTLGRLRALHSSLMPAVSNAAPPFPVILRSLAAPRPPDRACLKVYLC